MRACVYVGAHTHAGTRGHSISNPAVLKRYLIPTQVSPSLLVLATKGHCILAPYTICLNLNYITLHIAWHRKGCQLATQSVPKQVASVCTLLPKHPPFFPHMLSLDCLLSFRASAFLFSSAANLSLLQGCCDLFFFKGVIFSSHFQACGKGVGSRCLYLAWQFDTRFFPRQFSKYYAAFPQNPFTDIFPVTKVWHGLFIVVLVSTIHPL